MTKNGKFKTFGGIQPSRAKVTIFEDKRAG
jgi:hypothetical protein